MYWDINKLDAVTFEVVYDDYNLQFKFKDTKGNCFEFQDLSLECIYFVHRLARTQD